MLILGPTGSGKEVVARMIHELSRRSVAKFQAVNCAALPDTLFESEIFGYEKGAFTGAHDRKPGRLELANDGTLFLDEIGDMSLIAQAKLLRVLEERRFERLGGHKSISVDFRLISATNRPLEQFVRDGRFREDLYYRVNAFAIRPAVAARAAGGHPGARAALPGALLRGAGAAARQQGVLARGASSCCAATTGRATSASWKARCRARRCRRRADRSARRDIEFLHATTPRRSPSGDRLPSLAEAERAHIVPRARGGAVEQEGGRARARHQPGHAVPEDRRVSARSPSAPGAARRRE